MKRACSVLALLLLVAAVGCGSKPASDTSSSTPSSSATPAPVTPAPAADTAVVLAKSLYDDGPRASAAPVIAAHVVEGGALFKAKGCTVCHGWGAKLTCPDLKGVTNRRTETWMEHQILHPEVMVKTDPISHGLRASYALQMTNLALTAEQAHKVIEYLKDRDKRGK